MKINPNHLPWYPHVDSEGNVIYTDIPPKDYELIHETS